MIMATLVKRGVFWRTTPWGGGNGGGPDWRAPREGSGHVVAVEGGDGGGRGCYSYYHRNVEDAAAVAAADAAVVAEIDGCGGED